MRNTKNYAEAFEKWITFEDDMKTTNYIYLSNSLGEVTWCEDKQTDDDVEYIKSDYVLELIKIAIEEYKKGIKTQ